MLVPWQFKCKKIEVKLKKAVSIWLRTLSFKSCWFYILCVCVCVSVFHDVADSLHWTWADCQTQQSISATSLSRLHPLSLVLSLSPSLSPYPPLSLALPSTPPLSLHPYQCRPICLSFNFSFQVQFFWRPLNPPPTTTSLPPFLSSSTGLSICRALSLRLSLSLINMPRHVVLTCQSSHDPHQHVYCVELVHICLCEGFCKWLWECAVSKISETSHPSWFKGKGKVQVVEDVPNSEINNVSF